MRHSRAGFMFFIRYLQLNSDVVYQDWGWIAPRDRRESIFGRRWTPASGGKRPERGCPPIAAAGPAAARTWLPPAGSPERARGTRLKEMRSRPVSRVLSRLAPRDSHSSGTVVTHSLEQPTREQRGPRYRSPIWSCTGWGLPCRPCRHVRGGLLPASRYVAPPPRDCRETPFHPCLIPCGPSAVCSLLHFPSPHDARPLAGILPCGARTFLPAHEVRSDCPADFARRLSAPGARYANARCAGTPRSARKAQAILTSLPYFP